jgi:hypothetical protein
MSLAGTYAYLHRSRLAKCTETFGGGYGSTVRGYNTFGNLLSTMQNGCGTAGAHCYASGVLSYAVSGPTNHYADLTYDDLGDCRGGDDRNNDQLAPPNE